MNLRLLNFLSLYAYMYSNSAFGMNDLRGADRFLEIYRRVDPDNPEAFYQTASLRSKQGEMEETIKNLQKAGDLGFDDAARFHADPQFSGLQNAPVFGKIWEQFNLNKDKD